MKIGGEHYGCRENTLSVFTLTLAVELLPPLVKHKHIWLVANENLGIFTLSEKDITDNGVSYSRVIIKIKAYKLLHSSLRAKHKRVNINARASDGKKTYRGENRKSAAYVIGNNEGLVTRFIGELLESSARLVGGDEDSVLCSILTVLFYKKGLEYSECNSRLGCSAGLRDNVYGNILALADREKLGKSCG